MAEVKAPKGTITITFGDQAENHAGMEVIGTKAASGFSLDDLTKARENFESKGADCELYDLSELADVKGETAHLLVARGAIHALADPDEMLWELAALNWDKKANMYGRVVSKDARWNLCFDVADREPDYEVGKGRIVKYAGELKRIRDALPGMLGEKAANLVAEGNYYYDAAKCYIGWHGDAERRRVVAVRLGETMPLAFQWYEKGAAIGKKLIVDLDHGDMYVMSEKAVGTDWRRRSPQLRHAAGTKAVGA